jgi:RHS repeat-associated protein
MTLHRNGFQDGSELSTPFEIDNLMYGYAANSNRLLSVHDQSNKLDGFKDGNLTGVDFEYDGNGNMTIDRNKKIISIKYNHLNLPTTINFENGSVINYFYNAVGVKVVKTVGVVIAPQEVELTETYYLGGFQYKNQLLTFFPTSEGYVNVIDGDKYNYVFNYTDHLGNIRVSYTFDQNDQQLKILEENHYYPFGLKHSSYNTDKAQYKKEVGGFSVILSSVERSDYQYKFQGQERQDELGLNWDSFKWRNYDMAIGRFMSIDPLAEDYVHNSTYAFAENKVISHVELEGLEGVHTSQVNAAGDVEHTISKNVVVLT